MGGIGGRRHMAPPVHHLGRGVPTTFLQVQPRRFDTPYLGVLGSLFAEMSDCLVPDAVRYN